MKDETILTVCNRLVLQQICLAAEMFKEIIDSVD